LREDETGWDKEKAQRIIASYTAEQGGTLPILHDLQAEFGYVPEGAVQMIATALNLSRAEVHGVLTFYHEFRQHPPGRHVLRLCRAEACQSMGGEALAAQAKAYLHAGWGETSPDGAVTLEQVFCLGLCACAPAAMLDGTPVGRLNPARLDALLGQTIAKEGAPS
jgi:formate dehydrogenase subunit gamma